MLDLPPPRRHERSLSLKLSAKKLKYIQRRALKRSPGDLARELNIPLRQVQKVLKQHPPGKSAHGSKDAHPPAPGLPMGFLALLAAAAPLMVMPAIYDFANLPQSIFIQAGVLLLLSVGCLQAASGPESFRLLTGGRIAIPAVLFLGWSLLSLLWSPNPYEGWLIWKHWCCCCLVMLLTANWARAADLRRKLLMAIFVSGVLVACLGIYQHLTTSSPVPQLSAPAATFANKNMAAQFAVLILPLGFGLLLTTPHEALKWVWSLTIGLVAVFLIYTRTKAAWLAVGVETACFGLLWGWLKLRGRQLPTLDRAFWGRAAVVMVVVLLLANTGPRGFSLKLGMGSGETSVEGSRGGQTQPTPVSAGYSSLGIRMAIWRNTLAMVADHPWIGVGLGNHKVYYPIYVRRAVIERNFSETSQLAHVHNDFLQILSELGLAGLLLTCGLMATLGWIGLRLLTRAGFRERVWTMALIAAMTGILANANFSFPFQRAIPPFVLACFAGLLFAAWDSLEGQSKKRLTSRMWGGSGLVFMVIFLMVTVGGVSQIAADRSYLSLEAAVKTKNWPAVVDAGRQVLAANPRRTKVHSYLGLAHIESKKMRPAIESLEKVLASYPYFLNALVNLGVAYGHSGQPDRALEMYRQALAIKPDYAKVHNNIAHVYLKQQQPADALASLRLAARFDPQNAVFEYNLGVVAQDQQQYQEAHRAYTRALSLKPDWGLAHKQLGIVLYDFLDQREKGLAHIQRALAINPAIDGHEHLRRVLTAAKQSSVPNRSQAQ